jgi:hypothetical protein
MRQMFVGWKNRNSNGYFKAKLIFLCALMSLAIAYLLFQNSRKTVQAAGQATVINDEASVIKNSLLQPIFKVEGRPTDARETQELESIFTSSDDAAATAATRHAVLSAVPATSAAAQTPSRSPKSSKSILPGRKRKHWANWKWKRQWHNSGREYVSSFRPRFESALLHAQRQDTISSGWNKKRGLPVFGDGDR